MRHIIHVPNMKELILTIDEIAKYSLKPNIYFENKEKDLEKNLVKFYNFYFEIKFEFDEKDYPDFDETELPNLIENIKSNFRNFGFYKTILDINETNDTSDVAFGDAIDDLVDISKDLLEIKWRIQNTSLNDGLWFFDFIFKSHTKQHILDLLNYLEQIEN